VDDAGRGPAERYRAALPGSLHELEITGYDRAGVPTVSAEWVSAGAPPSGGPSSQTGIGYGRTPGAAATGAWGELTEELLLARCVGRVPPTAGSYAELVRARGAERVADPVSLVLPAGCDASPDRPLLWLPAVRWRTGEEVLVPAEFVAASPGTLPFAPPSGEWLAPPITNGLGAGDTLERAVLHGLLELVQRDGNTVSHRALDTGVVVDPADAADPELHALIGDLAARGIDVDLKLASTEFATVVHAVGTDRAAAAGEAPVVPVALSALGEAAHPDPVQAARKAVLEYAASRSRRAFAFGPLDEVRRRDPGYLERELARPLPAQEERALAAMTAWTRLSAAEMTAVLAPMTARGTTVPFGSLPAPAPDRARAWDDPATLLAEVLDRLAAFDVLVVAERADGPLGPVHAAKVVAPGLEVETLSYLRIGERVLRRLLERDSPLVGLGPAGGSRLPVRLDAGAVERLGGPAWLDADEVDRVVGPLYPLYREPSRHAVERIRLGL
jgi:ribosomal protein S12 methylthiotransferase accessory factor